MPQPNQLVDDAGSVAAGIAAAVSGAAVSDTGSVMGVAAVAAADDCAEADPTGAAAVVWMEVDGSGAADAGVTAGATGALARMASTWRSTSTPGVL